MLSYNGGTEALHSAFAAALADKHVESVKAAIDILAHRFCDGDGCEGFQKDGPVAVARFEGAEDWNADSRVLRQCELSVVIQDAIEPFI